MEKSSIHLLDIYKQHLYANHTKATADRYLRELESLARFVTPLADAGFEDLHNYMNHQAQFYENKETLTVIVCAINKYYKFLLKEGYRETNPSSSLQLAKRTPRQIYHSSLFTEQELERLFDVPDRYSLLENRNQLMISLMIYQGLTRGEIVNLTTSSIDLRKGTINIAYYCNRIAPRLLELRPSQISLYLNYLHYDRPKLLRGKQSTALFISKLGRPESGETVSYLVERGRRLFTKPINPVIIRKSVISRIVNQEEGGMRVWQQKTGIRWPSSLECYVNKADEMKTIIQQYHPRNK